MSAELDRRACCSFLLSFSAAVAIIGDEDTVTGFLLAGIGHRDNRNQTNYLVVDAESELGGERMERLRDSSVAPAAHSPSFCFCPLTETKHEEIVNAFKSFTSRDDISVILITQRNQLRATRPR